MTSPSAVTLAANSFKPEMPPAPNPPGNDPPLEKRMQGPLQKWQEVNPVEFSDPMQQIGHPGLSYRWYKDKTHLYQIHFWEGRYIVSELYSLDSHWGLIMLPHLEREEAEKINDKEVQTARDQ